jgi:hypothetical protein
MTNQNEGVFLSKEDGREIQNMIIPINTKKVLCM